MIDEKTICRLSLCVVAAAMLVGGGGGANYNVHYNSMGLAPGSYIPLAQGEVPRPMPISAFTLPFFQ